LDNLSACYFCIIKKSNLKVERDAGLKVEMEAKGMLVIWNKAKEISQKVYCLVQTQDEKIARYEAKVRKVKVLIIANASTASNVEALTLLVNDEVFQEGDSVLASLVEQVSNLEA
jgi:hypothetical protein